jgi:hypothetical protein
MIDSGHYTEAEATALVGRFVRARRHWSGIPGGAQGLVIRATPGSEGWQILISWNLPKEMKRQTDGLPVGRADFERVLEEIDR